MKKEDGEGMEMADDDLEILIAARKKAAEKVKENPSAANIAAFEKAMAVLNDYTSEKNDDSEKNARKETPYEETKVAAEVLRWLQENGYQREKSQFYDDIDFGKLKKNNDGIFTVRLVKKYARTLPRVATGKTEKEERFDIGYEKQQEEVNQLKLKNKREQLKFDIEQGKYIQREQFEQELAARLVVLDNGIRRLAVEKAPELVHLVGGDQARADELANALADAWVDLLNNYGSTKEYHVLIVPDGPEQGDMETR